MLPDDVIQRQREALTRVIKAVPEEAKHDLAPDIRLLYTVLSFVETLFEGRKAVETSASAVKGPEGQPVEQPAPPAPTSPQQPESPAPSLPPGPMTPQRRRQ